MTRERWGEAELEAALNVPVPSARLQAALTAGMHPDPAFVDVLVARCATETDFFVRDMLTWALVRHDPEAIVERLLPELRSALPQARSQALHTLSKIGDPRTWEAISTELLQDDDDEVARTAWRTAAALVPADRESELADTLATQFDRGVPHIQLSLSRAFAALGAGAAAVVERATVDPDPGVRAHAIATERIMSDPEEDFGSAIAAARRAVALLGVPLVEDVGC